MFFLLASVSARCPRTCKTFFVAKSSGRQSLTSPSHGSPAPFKGLATALRWRLSVTKPQGFRFYSSQVLERIAENCSLSRERGPSIHVSVGMRAYVRCRGQVGVTQQILNKFLSCWFFG